MRRVLWALILIAASAAPASAQQAVNLAFATLDTGSAWYVYGATMAEILRKTLPPGSNIDVKPRAGGVGNPRLVAKNETPLGFGFTVTNRWAYEGKEAYDARLDNLRALVGGLDTYYMVAVAAKKLGIGSVRDIKERRLAVRATSQPVGDRKSTRLNSSHTVISYAVFCLKKKKQKVDNTHANKPKTAHYT